jgi:uncharacterized protein (TIGR02246 family)
MVNNAESEKEIRKLSESWEAAVEKKDVDAILAAYSEDVVVFDVPPPLQVKGREAYRKHWEDWLKIFKGDIKCEFKDTQITAGEDVAFLTTLTRIGEKEIPESGSWVRVTVGYQKKDGKWLATHEHASIPAS